ncbi:MAG: hypothetical protein AAB074_22250 [Planctomycetota bacterium]
MRLVVLSFCLCMVTGCASTDDGAGPARLTGDQKLNRCFAEMKVTTCTVGGLPSSKAGASVQARASTKVAAKDGSADPHHAKIKVFDPAADGLKDPDAAGNLLVPAGGALVALLGSGGAAVWFLHDTSKGGGDVEIAGGGDTPVSVPTQRPTDPSNVRITANTPRGTFDCTPIASTGEAVCALAPLTPEDAGRVTLTATEGDQVVGTEVISAVYNSIQFVPESIQPGQTGQLVGQFSPAGRNIRVVITLQGAQTTPVLLVPGKVAGGPGNYTITLTGLSHTLSVPILTVQGVDQPIQAAADVQEVK